MIKKVDWEKLRDKNNDVLQKQITGCKFLQFCEISTAGQTAVGQLNWKDDSQDNPPHR